MTDLSLQSIPILLTSSVIPHDLNVSLNDPKARLHHAIESVAAWQGIRPEAPLVLCDGSGFNFEPIIRPLFPAADIEYLHFANDQASVALYGRGFGEGEIIRYAINNSEKISNAGCFTKCSSKLWVANYSQFEAEWNGIMLFHGVFNNTIKPFSKCTISYIDTRFYIINLSVYREVFINAHDEIKKLNNISLETVFLSILLRKNLINYLTTTPPIISGVGGSIGKYYKNSYHRYLKDKIRIFFAKRNARYKNLFITK